MKPQLITVALLLLVATPGDGRNLLTIPRTNGEIKIDGRVDERLWESIEPLPLTMHWPDFRGKSDEKTLIRLAYDNNYLYVSAICYDSQPDKIQATTFQRDGWGLQMDQIAIGLDPYNDNENLLFFVVTPSGSRIDAAIKNDAQGDDAASTSWNSYWIANSTIDENGWQTELRIPFGSLRFQEVDDKVTMGLIAYRYTARNKEMNIYPAIPPDWGIWSFAKASQAQDVQFESVQNKRPWYTSPYLLAGLGYHHEHQEEQMEKIDDDNLQVGLDVQHALTDNLNLDLSVNTDFAQVEADNQQVNLSRFSLFFPEKRRFFLERASTFDFKFEDNNNMFYSRRIGIEDGNLIPLYGGIRMVSRLDKWDLGVINMQSRSKDDIPSTNYGVLRVRRNVLNPRSYIGGMLTTRIDENNNQNLVYGIDGIINVFKQDYLQVSLAQSYDSPDTLNTTFPERTRAYIMWENRIINGFGYRFSYSNVGQHYNPGVGFERRLNFTQFGDQLFYSWFAPESSKLRQTTITLMGNISLNNASRDIETYNLGLSSSWEWNRGSQLNIALTNFHDNVPEAFDLSEDIRIAAGSYDNVSGTITYRTPPVSFFRATFIGQLGTFYGGELKQISATPELVISKYFQASAFYAYTLINFENETDFKSHLGRLNLTTSLNVKWTLNTFIQFNSLEKINAINARLRYAPIDGNDLYVVYNETLNSENYFGDTTLPLSENRAVIVKYIHTFML